MIKIKNIVQVGVKNQYHIWHYSHIAAIRKTFNRVFTDRLSDPVYIYLDYLYSTKKMLNLKNPCRYSEKIQWIKIYGNLEQYAKYTDKYEVRKYITGILGKEYLVPLIGVWDKFEDISIDDLPEKFVLKATHGSDYNYICKDKATLDKKQLKILISKWMDENFYDLNRERQYKRCQPRIICEKYLEDESGTLTDYKFLCFNGKPYYIEVMTDRFKDLTSNTYDTDWNKTPLSYKGFKKSTKEIERPDNLNEMLSISKRLSDKFPFVRVDLYSISGKIYFGELTFTPGNGMDIPCPDQFDYKLGNLLDLTAFMNASTGYNPFLPTFGKRKVYK